MKLTTKQRIAAYEYALNTSPEVRDEWQGVCNWLRLWVYKKGLIHHISVSDIPKYFSEFKKFKPINPDVHWFSNNKERDTCLELCILMAEEKL